MFKDSKKRDLDRSHSSSQSDEEPLDELITGLKRSISNEEEL